MTSGAVLHHHGDRLPQQPAAHRHGVREDRRRRPGPVPPDGRARRPLPDGQRREHDQGLPARRGAGRRAQAVRRRHGPPVPGGLGGARDLQRRLHPDQRGAPPRRLPEVHPGRLRRGRHLQEAYTRASTATAARRSRPRRKSPSGGAARTTRTRRSARVEEENYFFRLSAFGDRLLAHYAAHPEFIQPESRRNEIVNLVESGSRTSRSPARGSPGASRVPFDPEQTIYVWFDALLNYITAIGYGTDEERFRSLLAGRRPRHRQGHHPVPLRPLAGDADVGRARRCRSRSSGTASSTQERGDRRGQQVARAWATSIEPMDVYPQVLGAEAFRYYFMSECPFGGDGEFCVRAVRRRLQHRPGQQPGEPLQPDPDRCASSTSRATSTGSAAVDPTAWRAGLDLPALVGELRERWSARSSTTSALQRIWLEVLDAANRYIQDDRAVQAGQDRPRRLPAPCWSTWPRRSAWSPS